MNGVKHKKRKSIVEKKPHTGETGFGDSRSENGEGVRGGSDAGVLTMGSGSC